MATEKEQVYGYVSPDVKARRCISRRSVKRKGTRRTVRSIPAVWLPSSIRPFRAMAQAA